MFLQPPVFVRCEDYYVTYKLTIVQVYVTATNIIGKRTIVIETSDTFADVVIPYGKAYYAEVFAVNELEFVSERNFTAVIELLPGMPPKDKNTNKGGS